MSSLKIDSVFSVKGIIAVVTGAGSGLGATIANALAANGAAKVYIIGRRIEQLQQTASSYPDIIVPIQGDITSQESLSAAAKHVAEDTGFINLFVANSGTLGPTTLPMPGTSLSEIARSYFAVPMSEFDATYRLNVTATFYSILVFLELLDAGNRKGNMGLANQSQVVINGSSAAVTRRMMMMAYATSKAAVMHVGKMMATMLAEHGIRVNTIMAGLFETDLSENMVNGLKVPGTEDNPQYEFSVIPTRRLAGDEDIAGAILFLASRAGGYASGLNLVMDGGHLNVVPGTY